MIVSKQSHGHEGNTCTIDETEERMGIGIYLITSLVNHSCDPNSFVSFGRVGAPIRLRNTRLIKKGEEITISYVNLQS